MDSQSLTRNSAPHKNRQPYRPANEHDAEAFFERNCELCSRESAFRDDPRKNDQCPIAARALIHSTDDPRFPTEWITDDKGARCTAYTTDEIPVERCPFTPDLFPETIAEEA